MTQEQFEMMQQQHMMGGGMQIDLS